MKAAISLMASCGIQERMGWTNIVIKIKIGCAVHMVRDGLVDYCQVMNFYDSKNVHVVNLIFLVSFVLLFLGLNEDSSA